MKSIEKQLNWSLSISVLLVFFVFWWISVFTIHHLTEDYILTRLQHDTVSIEKHLNRASTGQNLPSIDYDAINPIYAQPLSGHYFVIQLGHRTLKSQSLQDYPLFLKNSPDKISHYETKGPVEGTILVRRFHTFYQQQPMTLFVAEDHSPIQRTLQIFDTLIGIFALLTLLLLYWGQKTLLRKGFKQLDPIHEALKNLHKGEVSQLKTEDYPAEVSELIENLNQAMLSASHQLQKSRQSNANLAHSLKTPLNMIYQLLNDVAMKDHPELQKTLQEQAKKIHNRIESELKKARLASSNMSVQPFSTLQDLTDLTQSIQQLYPDKQLHLQKMPDTPETLPIEKEDGYELLGNLLDNAAKFGQHNLYITFRPHLDESTGQTQTRITIEDDGAGVPIEKMTEIQTRGHRLDESIAGHGIGLSIVQQTVEAYAIDLQFGSSDKGGLKVTLTL
ncbi:sensor histidine kinase [Hydrogenovibrio sp. 3SP14C1]|uniref:sensor histidine kinase n=1 Tax=Hydrogenovibrio sp. 3SP14C1 TaxID=3038774 RepID=UPI002415F973|nr:sensor histidine kinase [Hydrogenovibrio sp. 3SP14C1]MDG4811593.1 sensor histidine kinase [Hydrogenovibrio sp. 3SP14C1]